MPTDHTTSSTARPDRITPATAASSADDPPSIESIVDWLRRHGQTSGRLSAYRVQPGADPAPAADGGQLTGAILSQLPPGLRHTLAERGIERLYAHQARAIGAVQDGQHVVLATPTASGKSLAYQIPALERALRASRHTLYIAPQRALINDQESTLTSLAKSASAQGDGLTDDVTVGKYTGQLTTAERRATRDQQPQLLATTPDMVNYSLLPYAGKLWQWFFQHLDLVVLDEIHRYRGVFGTHVSHVLRRLRRLCSEFDAAPQLFCCSATIANPTRHAAMLTGAPPETFATISTDTSPSGPTHWLFWDPPTRGDQGADGSSGDPSRHPTSHDEAARLVAILASQGLQTVVFTQSRQLAEQYAQCTATHLQDRGYDGLAGRVAAYQAGLAPDERTRLEEQLHDGRLRAVWSTTALSLGIDIGGLDAVILDGYPGTRMETHQQAGRAGRNGDPSLVILVGSASPLDQYVLDNPDDLLEAPPENALINPMNGAILDQHLPAAAVEYPLTPVDEAFFTSSFPDRVRDLTNTGVLDRTVTSSGVRWTAGRPLATTGSGVLGTGATDNTPTVDTPSSTADTPTTDDGTDDETADSATSHTTDDVATTDDTTAPDDDANTDDEPAESPQYRIDLRTIADRTVVLKHARTQEELGELSFPDALREAHPGAIYFSQGEQYVVSEFDTDVDVAYLAPTDVDYRTIAERDRSVAIEAVLNKRSLTPDATAQLCSVTVTDEVVGYRRLSGEDRSTLRPLGLPPTTRSTRALAITLSPSVVDALRQQSSGQRRRRGDRSPPEARALQGLAHVLVHLAPLELLCDRSDLGSTVTSRHEHMDAPTLFLYDSHGGVGLARGCFSEIESLLEAAVNRIDDCECERGCPGCVHHPHSGRANVTADKHLAAWLAAGLS